MDNLEIAINLAKRKPLMVATLKRHNFKDRPDWQVIREEVPLGTEYQVYGVREKGISIRNLETNEERPVPCYFVKRVDDDSMGWVPSELFHE